VVAFHPACHRSTPTFAEAENDDDFSEDEEGELRAKLYRSSSHQSQR
jgi:hypothetical protein